MATSIVALPTLPIVVAQPRREWYSGAELAGLPGLPGTDRGVRKKADRESWGWRDRPERGGGREYHIDSLPRSTRAALILRERGRVQQSDPGADRAAELWASYERKSDKVKGEAARRVDAINAVEQLVHEGCQRLEAYSMVAHQLGESESTIRNWWRVVRAEPPQIWAPLLAPKYTGRTKTAEYDPRIYDWFRALFLNSSRPPASTCYRRAERLAKAEGLAMPSCATLCRELKRREDPSVVLLEREGSRALEASFPYLERSRDGLYAMQMVNADGHNLDLSVVWPDGEQVRATLLAIQDVYSSAIVGWKLMKSETAHGMSLAFLDAFDKNGIPQRIFVDNTLAAASKRMTAGAPGRKRFRDREGDPIGVLPSLGIQVTFTTPAHGQSKPIERSFRSLADLISKHPAFSGAYLGNSPANKPGDYGTRTIAIDELEPVVRNEIAAYNAQLGRRTEVCAGTRSFQDAFESSYREHSHLIARLTPNQRRLLYLVADRVTVDRRDGCVKLFGNRYWSEEVSRLKGKQVVLRYDPTETLHKSVWVYRLEGTLVGEVPVYSKAGFADAEAAQSHTRARRQHVRAKKDLAKATRRLKAAAVAAMVPDHVDALAPPPDSVRRVDFALAASMEDAGGRRRDEEAERRVSAAISTFADNDILAPKRKRA